MRESAFFSFLVIYHQMDLNAVSLNNFSMFSHGLEDVFADLSIVTWPLFPTELTNRIPPPPI